MTLTSTNQCWWPIALACDIKLTSPHAIVFNGKPLVAFRSGNNQAHLLNDWCPHRFAPLSKGKIINGELQCPYHGWQFNGKGVCTRVPGLGNPAGSSSLVQTYRTKEEVGLLWVSESSDLSHIALPNPQHENLDSFFIQGYVQCELIDLIENFLDGFHTHFIHSGWIRKDKQRQIIQAKIKPLADGIEVEYSGETSQNGFISRRLEGERGISLARFRLPNMAEIEYRDSKNCLSLLATLWATPTTDSHHKVFVRIATPQRIAPASLKAFFLRKLFNKIMQQDKNILELAYALKRDISNINLAPLNPLDTSNDLLAGLLRQLISTNTPIDFEPRVHVVQL
jgi:phenylpropionate dioxygenase-like ring-hydroxylating dioxygenase large terminal subunit